MLRSAVGYFGFHNLVSVFITSVAAPVKCHYTPVANEWTYFGTGKFARCWQRLFNGVRVTLRSQAVLDMPRNAGHDLSRPAKSAGNTPLRRAHQRKKRRTLANSRGVAGNSDTQRY